MNRPSPTLRNSAAPWAALACAAALLTAGCSRPGPGASVKPEVIQNIGSDTMVNLAQA